MFEPAEQLAGDFATWIDENQDDICLMVTGIALTFIAAALVKEIQADTQLGLPHLSWQEIGMVIRRAVLGAGKELFGVSVASLYGALADYAKTEGHEADKKRNY